MHAHRLLVAELVTQLRQVLVQLRQRLLVHGLRGHEGGELLEGVAGLKQVRRCRLAAFLATRRPQPARQVVEVHELRW